MVITSIHIYPIKSLAGISVNSAEARRTGFVNDRQLMLVDESGGFLSQREHAKLALFNCQLDQSQLTVNRLSEVIKIDLNNNSDVTQEVTVWDSSLQAYVYNQPTNEWFSDQLGQHVRLVSMGEKSERVKTFSKAPFETLVSFADGYPYLIIGEESLSYLNNQLDTPLPMDRFRGNIIVSSDEAHIEDELGHFDLGQATFQNIKPCARCIVTTINQQTSQKGKEPLATLAKYRKVDNKIYFGSNLICLKKGIVKVGDKLQRIEA